jgi:hypothetical protein
MFNKLKKKIRHVFKDSKCLIKWIQEYYNHIKLLLKGILSIAVVFPDWSIFRLNIPFDLFPREGNTAPTPHHSGVFHLCKIEP